MNALSIGLGIAIPKVGTFGSGEVMPDGVYYVDDPERKPYMVDDAETTYYSPTDPTLQLVDEETFSGPPEDLKMAWGADPLLIYRVGSAGYARMALINNGVIESLGSAVEFDPNCSNIDVCSLSTTKALVVYRDGVESQIRARVLTISGLSISMGDEATLVGDTRTVRSLCVMSDSKVLMNTMYNNTETGIFCLTVSGSSVTADSYRPVQSFTYSSTMCKITDEYALHAYSSRSSGVPSWCGVQCIRLSGTTLTMPDPNTTVSYRLWELALARFDGEYAILAGAKYGSNSSVALVVKLTGTTITKGDEFEYADTQVYGNDALTWSSTRALVAGYRYGDSSGTGNVYLLERNGMGLTLGGTIEFEASGMTTPPELGSTESNLAAILHKVPGSGVGSLQTLIWE